MKVRWILCGCVWFFGDGGAAMEVKGAMEVRECAVYRWRLL